MPCETTILCVSTKQWLRGFVTLFIADQKNMKRNANNQSWAPKPEVVQSIGYCNVSINVGFLLSYKLSFFSDVIS